MLRISPARPTDAAAIAQLHRRAICQTNAQSYPASVILPWVKSVSAASVRAQLATTRWEVVRQRGTITAFSQWDPAGTVYQIQVDPATQGQGLGSALHARIEDGARRAGTTVLRLFATKNAVPFYRHLGYRRTGTVRFPLAPGVTLEMVRMRKELT